MEGKKGIELAARARLDAEQEVNAVKETLGRLE